jgi:biotin synthase-like enzyme
MERNMMKIYEALLKVKQAADPLRTTQGITPENRDEAIQHLEELLTSAKSAIDAGATRYDMICAVAGKVPEYLKEAS